MIKLKTNKSKLFAAIGILLFGTIVIYQLSIKVTVEEYQKQQQLIQQFSKINNQIQNGKSKNELAFSPEKIYLQKDSVNVERNNLYDAVNTITMDNNTKIENFSSRKSIRIDNHSINTQVIVISGNYPDIMESLFDIEKSHLKFKINSVKFTKVRNIKAKKYQLILSLYFQSVNLSDA